ncbi:MAG: hypothetical protein KatS3mg087_1399 [Patescibacteria group bacterium]|nr:MAG: hypothetical protein KatS3mg087_1399 [Patescibacteria group bacterium]
MRPADLETVRKVVYSTCKSGTAISEEISPRKAHLIHMAMGISGEAGELLDCIKKYVIYNKPLDVNNLIEEIGDIFYFLVGLMEWEGIDPEVVISALEHKLYTRYTSGYSDEAAQNRADKQ